MASPRVTVAAHPWSLAVAHGAPDVAQASAATTGAAYPMCVCTQNEPTPTATGSAQRSPHVDAQTSMRNAPNGSTVTNGFHGFGEERRRAASP